MREIARTAGTTPSVLQRDLARLADAGVLTRVVEGRQVYYQADPACPIHAELRGIAVKTFGVADVLRTMLAPHRAALKLAFVYGSIAAGRTTAASDIDLMIVGDLELSSIVTALLDAEQQLGRPVNPTVFREAEFRDGVARREPFLSAVLSRPMIFVIGGADDLRELQGESAASR